jgi:large subunit ribosomal protein L32e
MKYQFMGSLPKIGYKNAAEVRGMHPSNMKEVLVNTPSELDSLKGVVVRIASTVGAKKRKVIEEKAHGMKLAVVNAKFLKAEPKKSFKKSEGAKK